jgi:hypothetical protein
LKIDLDELHNLRGEDAKYEARLSELFFQDPNIQSAFDTARTAANAEGESAVLRVRLFLDAGADALHHVRWECLRDTKGKSLFNGDTILFSRYLASSELRPVSGKTTPKALIAIANPHLASSIDPEDPSKALPPVDVPNEKLRAESGLNNAGFSVTTLASPPNGTVPARLPINCRNPGLLRLKNLLDSGRAALEVPQRIPYDRQAISAVGARASLALALHFSL